ncbi:exlusion protein FxsA, partial [Sulfitobacter sp. HI0040]
MWLLFAFIAVPLIEIALFIQVGGLIGLGWTLAIVLITAVLGTWLVRSQGALALGQLRSSFNDLRDPTEPLVHGALILFAGALLLTPGFFTDAVGFSLLVPQIRHTIYEQIRNRVRIHTAGGPQPGGPGGPRGPVRPTRGGDVIEGDYVEIDETPPTEER